jgi:hypothetical protein
MSVVEDGRLVRTQRGVDEIAERRIRREVLEGQIRTGEIDRVTDERRRWEAGDPPPTGVTR